MKRSSRQEWKVTVLKGDGIGPEVIEAALEVLEAAKERFGLDIVTENAEAGYGCISKKGTNLPKETIKLLKVSDCVIKGPMTTPEGPDSETSVAVKIRRMFDLYADIRPFKAMQGVDSIKDKTDLVIVRENTEGLYSGLDFNLSANTAVGIKVVTRSATNRIGRSAYALAMQRKKHLTIVHKANIMKSSDGLFKSAIEALGRDYKGVNVDDAHVDAMAQWLIKNPESYDVVVTDNLYGDILSDEAAMVVGGIGLIPSANIGRSFAMFEPVHGSAPKYTGKDTANPLGTILSVAMMLEWMGYNEAAKAVHTAVERSLKDKIKTRDVGGKSRCSAVAHYVSKIIRAKRQAI